MFKKEIVVILHTEAGDVVTSFAPMYHVAAIDTVSNYMQDGKKFTVEFRDL